MGEIENLIKFIRKKGVLLFGKQYIATYSSKQIANTINHNDLYKIMYVWKDEKGNTHDGVSKDVYTLLEANAFETAKVFKIKAHKNKSVIVTSPKWLDVQNEKRKARKKYYYCIYCGTKFLNNEIQILVATSVIEVGVNAVNATTIVVLGAGRFGVATLHQLRGRVMRSDSVPYCFFIEDKPTDVVNQRLRMVESTTDGFELANYDLKHRGPGEFFGEKQSGAMHFKYADLRKDSDILELANSDSEEIIQKEEFFTSEEYQTLRTIAQENYQRKMEQVD